LTLAAFGFLPPVFAAAAQSIPDVGILTNSARLLHQTDQNKSVWRFKSHVSDQKILESVKTS
jgi:hypothetical protein